MVKTGVGQSILFKFCDKIILSSDYPYGVTNCLELPDIGKEKWNGNALGNRKGAL